MAWLLVAAVLSGCDMLNKQPAAQQEKQAQENVAEDAAGKEPAAGEQSLAGENAGPRAGNYAILYKTFGTIEEAEANARQLREQRVNSFVFQDDNKKFAALIGPYPAYSHAEKQLKRLQRRGFADLSLYKLPDQL